MRHYNTGMLIKQIAFSFLPEHVVIGVTREHDLSGVELVNGAAGAPQVDGKVVLQTEDDLRRAIESDENKESY